MILIHIVLGLLKIIGILLLVVLSFVLFILLAVLFAPVRYQAYGYRDSKVGKGSVSVFWLARLIFCKASYNSQEKKTEWSVRIFGISVQKVMAWKKKRKQKKTSVKETQIKEIKTKESDIVLRQTEEQKKTKQDIEKPGPKGRKVETIEQKSEKVERIEVEADRKEKAEKSSPIALFLKKLKKILQKLKKIRITVRGICDKISEIQTFLKSEVFLNAKTLLIGEAKKLGIHIFPRKIQGKIEFGFDDPSLTGRVLAIAGICYPLYGKSIKITPYFDRKILEGELKVKGKIRGIVLLKSALKVGFNREIREIWKNFKR